MKERYIIRHKDGTQYIDYKREVTHKFTEAFQWVSYQDCLDALYFEFDDGNWDIVRIFVERGAVSERSNVDRVAESINDSWNEFMQERS